ncbi:MAG: SPFH domain-containing protein [Brevinemataceae bacterium]
MIVFSILLVIGLIFLIQSVRIVQQGQTLLIERLGKFHRKMEAGLNFLIPFLDIPRNVRWRFPVKRGTGYVYVERFSPLIDLRETVYDFPAQSVITKDNVGIEINAVIYYQIMDAAKSVYEIADLPQAIEKITQTTLRNLIGELELDQTLSSRDLINTKLQAILDEATDKWGVKVNRVELQDISPPKDIQVAMEKQMRAEREKREMILRAEGEKQAAILFAEGEKQARITEAQGFKESEILKAQGFAEARERIAQAEAESIRFISERIGSKDPSKYLIALKYIDTLKDLGSSGNKTIMIPYEASAMMGSLQSLKEIFNSKDTQ